MTYLDDARARLGAQRMDEFMRGIAMVDFNVHALVLGIGFAKDQGYSDEYVAILRRDALDVVAAAGQLKDVVDDLADAWQAQRLAAPPDPADALAFVRAQRDLVLARVHGQHHSGPSEGCADCEALLLVEPVDA